jgi:hypothetical protein
MRVLKYFLRKDCDDKELANLDAVLNAYRHRKLKVDDDLVTVWFAGHMTLGPLSGSDPKLDQIFEKVPEWQDMYGPGRIWLEEVCHHDIILICENSDTFSRQALLLQS